MSDKVLENEELNEELETVEISDDEGNSISCYFLGTMDYKEKTYAFFQEKKEDDDGDMFIYEVEGDDIDDEAVLCPIEDDDLLEEVYEAYIEEYQRTFPEEFEDN